MARPSIVVVICTQCTVVIDHVNLLPYLLLIYTVFDDYHNVLYSVIIYVHHMLKLVNLASGTELINSPTHRWWPVANKCYF